VFPEEEFSVLFDPLTDGPVLVSEINFDGLLIDTYRKDIGKGLLDYYSLEDLGRFVDGLHSLGKEAWLAGSVTEDELPGLWSTGVDVVCVRGAACEAKPGNQRFGAVQLGIVERLVGTIP
jgi:uncharacterized protein (UPF0264 family)